MKKTLRKEYLALRENLKMDRVSAASEKIFNFLKQLDLGSHIFIYVSMRNEVDTKPILDYLWSENKHVYLSKSNFNDQSMTLYEVNKDTPLIKNDWGILEPSEDNEELKDLSKLTSIIVPGLLFSREGHRMGYGKGFYDRFFEQAPHATRIALCMDEFLLEQIPYDAWDVPMDIIITENEVLSWQK